MARMATVFVGAILVLICSNAFTGLAIIYAKYRQDCFDTPFMRNFHLMRTRLSTNELQESEKPHPTIFFITPTYARLTQKVDLTSLCQTLMHVRSLVWIVVEDSEVKTPVVTHLLQRCPVTSIHFNVSSPDVLAIEQRYIGLKWVKENCRTPHCSGVVYFGDDDNKYDLKVFDEIRNTKTISVFNVGFAGGVAVEGPYCKDGKAMYWRTGWAPRRQFPLDMAGFAVNVTVFEKHPDVWVGKEQSGNHVKIGYMETKLLEMLGATKSSVECRSNNEEVLTWHIRTQKPKLVHSTSTIEA